MESRKIGKGEVVIDGGISLEMVELAEDDMLVAEPSGVKDENQGNSHLFCLGVGRRWWSQISGKWRKCE